MSRWDSQYMKQLNHESVFPWKRGWILRNYSSYVGKNDIQLNLVTSINNVSAGLGADVLVIVT